MKTFTSKLLATLLLSVLLVCFFWSPSVEGSEEQELLDAVELLEDLNSLSNLLEGRNSFEGSESESLIEGLKILESIGNLQNFEGLHQASSEQNVVDEVHEIEGVQTKKTSKVNRNHITIASFNIQVFGPTKMSKPHVSEKLVEILKRFSLIFIQEIRDSSQTAIFDLLYKLNAASPSHPYKIVVSSRAGRSASKEQYAYLFRSEDVKVLDVMEFDDVNNWYERPPYGAKIRTRFGQIVYLMGVHVSPKDAVSEIDHLHDVYTSFKKSWTESPDKFIIMGDLNAGCSYVTKTKWDKIRTRTLTNTYTWTIPDTQITTTVGGGNCPYDRFIIGNGIKALTDPVASVFNYTSELKLGLDLSREISDHYPIVMKLYEK